MPMFVDPTDRVPVTLDGNTIWIRAKMSVKEKARIESEFSVIKEQAGDDAQSTATTSLGLYSMVLLIENIVAWEGPAFVNAQGRPIPCNRVWIEKLDPHEPLIEMVREEIGLRNAKPAPPEDADPN